MTESWQDLYRRDLDRELDAACYEIHSKLMNNDGVPMTPTDYVLSWEFEAISFAAARHRRNDPDDA